MLCGRLCKLAREAERMSEKAGGWARSVPFVRTSQYRTQNEKRKTQQFLWVFNLCASRARA